MQQFVYPRQIPQAQPQASVGAVNIQIYNPTANPQGAMTQGVAPMYPQGGFYTPIPSTYSYPANYNNIGFQPQAVQNATPITSNISGQPQISSMPKQAVSTQPIAPELKQAIAPPPSSAKEALPSQTEATKEDKNAKKEEKKPIIPLTDEYIKTLENYMNNNNPKVRLMGMREVLDRFKEDEKRKSDPALTALLNKALKDRYSSVRFLALTAIDLGYAKGNDETIALLQQIQNMKENYGDDALLASKALLKIAGGQPQ